MYPRVLTMALALLALTIVPLQAQPPSIIDFQGKLTDNAGSPVVDDDYSVTFRIYDAVSTQVWTETHTVSTVDGLFSVQLGSNGSPLASNLFTESETYLGITVGGDPELTPRTRLAAVPYTYRSSLADVAYAVPTGSIGTHNIQDGTILFLDLADNGASPGQVIKWSGTAWEAAEDLTGSGGDADWTIDGDDMYSSPIGNVGIGNETPAEKLDVTGNIHASGTVSSGNSIVVDGVNDRITASSGILDFDDENLFTTGKMTIGAMHTNSGAAAFVAGANNSVTGDFSTVGGGTENLAGAEDAVVGGGEGNSATGSGATVAGGRYNTASGFGAAVVGGGGSGNSNVASGNQSSVGGGYLNTAGGNGSAVGGGNNNSANGEQTTIGGGQGNSTTSNFSVVAGGQDNVASGADAATVSGGRSNAASGQLSAIGGGSNNTASGSLTTVGGGMANAAHGYRTTISGGGENHVEGLFGSIGGGDRNRIEADYAVIPGGFADTIFATGDYSYLFGINSNLSADSTFMVDMPHIRFGDEATGYEVPTADGTSGQIMQTDGAGQLTWVSPNATGTGWADDGTVVRMESAADSVGIGTTTPTEKLDVDGNIQASGTIASGNSIVVDGVNDMITASGGTIDFDDDNLVTTGTATIGPGHSATGTNTFIAGLDNSTTGNNASVSGGSNNLAAINAAVGGGLQNGATGNSSFVGGGFRDTASGDNSFVGSGYENKARAAHTAVGGGWYNEATGQYATIGGGNQNLASGVSAVVGGGNSNDATGTAAAIVSGNSNVASGGSSFVGSGNQNVASANYSSISGGFRNTAGGSSSTIGGGYFNEVTGEYSAVSGGANNTVDANYSVIPGGRYNTIGAAAHYSFLFGINTTLLADSTFMVDLPHIVFGDAATGYEFPEGDGTASQVLQTDGAGNVSWATVAGGGGATGWTDDGTVVRLDAVTDSVGIGTTTPTARLDVVGDLKASGSATIGPGHTNTGTNSFVAGATNSTSAIYSTVLGHNNTAAGNRSTVGGGESHNAGGHYATIAGGQQNSASGLVSAVSGGAGVTAAGDYAYAGGGRFNSARGHYSVMAGGGGASAADSNAALGDYSTVSGGMKNYAHGDHTVIAGGGGTATIDSNSAIGAVSVIGGGQRNSITVGGFHSVINGGLSNTSGGAYAVVGGGTGNTASDRYNTISGGQNNNASQWYATIGGGGINSVTGRASTVSGGYDNDISAEYAAISGGRGNTISATGHYSYLFGIASTLNADSTFMVDLPHIRFGDETNGYEFPTTDGTASQVLQTDGSGNVTWGTVSGGGATGWTDDGTVVRLDGSGDSVGIGTSAPTERLDVVGSMRVSAKATIGSGNTNTGYMAFVAGQNNTAAGARTVVSGGGQNKVYGNYSLIAGGGGFSAADSNYIYADYSVIGGGRRNLIQGSVGTDLFATIAGGDSCRASGYASSIGGGSHNWAYGNADSATIAGGTHNTAQRPGAVIGGGTNNAAGNQFTTIAGGKDNAAGAGGGLSYGDFATVGGGEANDADRNYATIAGGYSNSVGGPTGTGDGYQAIAGGQNNSATNNWAAIGGGQDNIAGGEYSVVPGGYSNTIGSGAHYSVLFGINSQVNADSTFMVDMPHIRFGDATYGYEFPTTYGTTDFILQTDGAGQLNWVRPSGFELWGQRIRLGNGADSVGIGTTTPTAKLHVVGDICYTGTAGSCSDLRYKKDISPFSGALDRVRRMQAVSFNWRRDEFPEKEFTNVEQLGFIAQEIRNIVPYAVTQGSDGYYNVDYGKLTPLLIEAVKELSARNEAQTLELAGLKQQLADLAGVVESMSATQSAGSSANDLASK